MLTGGRGRDKRTQTGDTKSKLMMNKLRKGEAVTEWPSRENE